MEDTEYLPTCGFKPMGRWRENMLGKFLTKNIVLTAVCYGHHCIHTHSLSIEKLWSDGLKRCPECGSQMNIKEEFIIKN